MVTEFELDFLDNCVVITRRCVRTECTVVVINNFYRWFSFISAKTIHYASVFCICIFLFFLSLILLLHFFLCLIVAIVVASLVMLLWIFKNEKKRMQIAHNKNRYECWCLVYTLYYMLYRLKIYKKKKTVILYYIQTHTQSSNWHRHNKT